MDRFHTKVFCGASSSLYTISSLILALETLVRIGGMGVVVGSLDFPLLGESLSLSIYNVR